MEPHARPHYLARSRARQQAATVAPALRSERRLIPPDLAYSSSSRAIACTIAHPTCPVQASGLGGVGVAVGVAVPGGVAVGVDVGVGVGGNWSHDAGPLSTLFTDPVNEGLYFSW